MTHVSSVMGTGRPVSVYWRRRGMVLAGGAMGMLILLRACGGGAPPEITRAAAQVAVPLVSTYSPTPTATAPAAGVTEGVGTNTVLDPFTGLPVTAGTADPMPGGEPAVSVEPTPTSTIPTSQQLAKMMAAQRAATESPTAKPTATATATATASTRMAPKLTAKQAAALAAKKERARIAAASKQSCTTDALAVNLRSDKRIYKRGEKAQLFLAIKNVSDLPCRVDLGSGALSITIMSGNDRIWSSDDCQGKGTKDVRVLKPGQALEARSIWNGTRSAPGCPKGVPQARPGTYVVEGRAAGVEPKRRAVFTVKD